MRRSRDRLILMAERGRFLLSLDNGESWDGILIDWDDNHFVIADALHMSPGEAIKVKADGEIWIPRSRVLYMQKTPQ